MLTNDDIDIIVESLFKSIDLRVVIDELSLYCPTENLRAQDNKALETLILQGRRSLRYLTFSDGSF